MEDLFPPPLLSINIGPSIHLKHEVCCFVISPVLSGSTLQVFGATRSHDLFSFGVTEEIRPASHRHLIALRQALTPQPHGVVLKNMV